jgi:uncharacterized protein (TIRG00374 family)
MPNVALPHGDEATSDRNARDSAGVTQPSPKVDVEIATDGQRAPAPKRSLIGWGLRFLGPVILIVVIARLSKPRELVAILLAAHGAPLALAVLLNVVPVYLKVVRWQVVLRGRSIEYATKPAFLAYASSLYLGMLTPGRVGDVIRIQYLRHDTGARYAEGLASIVTDRLADLYVLAAFVAIGVAHYSSILPRELAILSWLMVGGTVVGPLVLFVPGVAEKLFATIYRRLARTQEADGLAHFLVAVRIGARARIVPVILLTVAAFLVNFVQGWLAARALGLDLGLFEVSCLSAIQSLMGLLPISVSGIGVREAFFAVVFPSLGYSATQGASFGLLVFFVVYLALVAMGAMAWQLKPPPTGLPPSGTPSTEPR